MRRKKNINYCPSFESFESIDYDLKTPLKDVTNKYCS